MDGTSIPDRISDQRVCLCYRDPESGGVVYILAVQNLSEQSALDAECLIKEVKPDVVVAQVTSSALAEIQAEEEHLRGDEESLVPTSLYGVLMRCFLDKTDRTQYESLAGSQVMREVFGVGFHGHFLAAKMAAEEVESQFLVLESPYLKTNTEQYVHEARTENKSLPFLSQSALLVPRRATSVVSKRVLLDENSQAQMVKTLCPSLSQLMMEQRSPRGLALDVCQPRCNYQAPSFAQPVYSLLNDLHEIFTDLPAMKSALAHAQKMLEDIYAGETMDTQLLSEVHNFRIAVEALRIALNNAGRCPIDKLGNQIPDPKEVDFTKLPLEEKGHVLFVQALKSQAKKFSKVVAIVDASSLGGLRRHWKTDVPTEVVDMAEQCFVTYDCEEEDEEEDMVAEHVEKKRLLAGKPVVAMGAGATAVIGVSSLSKAIPASTLVKLVTYKVPTVLKVVLANLQRSAAFGLGKFFGASQVMGPSTTLKATLSAEKIRALTHSVIISAERTSLLAIRTSFYEIMRNRRIRSFWVLPWATFSCSFVTCAGLLKYGDGIECAAESAPSAPMIASVGRGLQSLHQASQEAQQANRTKLQETLQSLMHNFKKMKLQ
ncbi:hypothetical protein QJS10_CPB04g01852 [Acorus calamus]|uniref:Transmembrane protein n=1 Tax=Acorus calamus TaxID=4465 RepID=A0AAV9EXN1_ACOCL|nr:hypothetical protein QJS10_CPB04g01852 [Acorus calamus]